MISPFPVPSSAAPNPCFQQWSRCNHKQTADTALCLTDQIIGICCCLSRAPAHGGCAATLPHHSTAAIDSVSPALLKGQGLFVPFSGLQRIVAEHPAWLFWLSLSCLDPMLLGHVSLQDLQLQKVHQAPSLENMIPGWHCQTVKAACSEPSCCFGLSAPAFSKSLISHHCHAWEASSQTGSSRFQLAGQWAPRHGPHQGKRQMPPWAATCWPSCAVPVTCLHRRWSAAMRNSVHMHYHKWSASCTGDESLPRATRAHLDFSLCDHSAKVHSDGAPSLNLQKRWPSALLCGHQQLWPSCHRNW